MAGMGLRLGLGLSFGGGGGPRPPTGFVWLMDNNGNNLTDNNGVWLYAPAGA